MHLPIALLCSNLRGVSMAVAGGGREAALEGVLAVAAAEGIGRRDASGHFEARCATAGAAMYRLLAKVGVYCHGGREGICRGRRRWVRTKTRGV